MKQEELENTIEFGAMKECGREAMQGHGKRELVVRTGEALKLKDPVPVCITGIIDTPLRWMERRHDILDPHRCHVVVNRDEMVITLCVDERDYFHDLIRGCLMLSTEFKKFGINSGEYTTGLQLSDLIRMNRSCFEDKAKAMELVTIMRNFKAKVSKDMELNDDKKGNRMAFVRQVVESNQPPAFELYIPIFKGQERQKFTVEIDIDPDTLQCTLVSPDAQDLIADMRDALMGEVLDGIRDICHEIPIVEI